MYSAEETAIDPNYTSATQVTDNKITLTNTLSSTDLTFTKVDEHDQPLNGVRFKLLDEQGKQIGEEQISNEAGLVTFPQLREGNYQLVEIEPLAGYQAIDPIQLTIEQNSDGEFVVTNPTNWSHKVVNKKITEQSSSSSENNSTSTSSSGNKQTTVSSKNKPTTTGQIPKAGEHVQSWLLIVGVLLIFVVSILYYKNKRSSL
ncbi:SpaA isopeptide-forming pilin-related protein [Enterococcus termitis]